MMQNFSSWHVLGGGAMGCLWAGSLAEKVGTRVTLLVREERLKQNTDIIEVESSALGRKTLHEINIENSASSEFVSPIKNLIVTTKCYDVSSALSSVFHRLEPHTNVLLMTNGMGIFEEVISKSKNNKNINYIIGSTTHGALLNDYLKVNHTGVGSTWIGNPLPSCIENINRTKEISTFLSNLSLGTCHYEDDIMRRLWLKLGVNACINPLTSLLRCKNGYLTKNDYSREMIANLCKEIVITMDKDGVKNVTADELENFVVSAAKATSLNESSMYRDIQFGKKTEIDYISGYIVKVAKEHHISVPKNEILFNLIKSIEKSH